MEITNSLTKPQKTKRQHVVPRMYLRYFASDKKQERIWVYDKPKGESYQSSIDTVAVNRYFYDLPDSMVYKGQHPPAPADQQVIETMLSGIEGKYATHLPNILSQVEKHGITDEIKEQLAPFIALQYVRTPYWRRMHEAIFDNLKEQDRLIRASGDEPHIVTPDGDFLPIGPLPDTIAHGFHLKAMVMEAEKGILADTLKQYIWVIGRNDTATPFYTSDTPVVTFQHDRRPEYSNASLLASGVEIVMPLTPRLALAMYERQFFESKPIILTENTTQPTTLRQVERANRLQILHCNRHVYSNSPDFDKAREVCNLYPATNDPQRQRFKVVSLPSMEDHRVETHLTERRRRYQEIVTRLKR